MIGDQRVSLREKIFREIIANMLIHREYTNAFPSSFIIYNDRVETKNANKPHVFGQLYPDTFQPFPKNPRLAQLFTQMGRSEELGTGLRNVYKFSQAYSGSNDIVFREENIFHVIIPIFNKTSPKIINRDTDRDTDRGQKIMDLIKKDAKITVIQMADNLSTSRSTILREIKKLKEKGKLKRIGKEKDGYWEVISLKL
jgi:ATP-dependent DNA helicase RecG